MQGVSEDQQRARVFGVLFLITFVTSIGALALFQSVLDDPAGYIAGDGKDSQIYLGAFLELLLIISNVGTAVVLYPIVRRQNELLAIGYVAARIIESVFIAGGIIFVLGVVSLRQDSPDAADLAVSLAALKDWTFLFGPGMIVPFGNGLILGYLMYKSGLVPRWMPWLGLIGGPLLLIGNVGVLFDWWDQTGAVPTILVIPEFLWELFLGIYAAVWGFRKDCADPRRRPAAWLRRPRPRRRTVCPTPSDRPADALPTSWQRLLALSGVAFAVLFVLAWFLSGGNTPDYAAADQDWTTWADDNQWKSRIGGFLILLAGFVFLHFAATIRSVLGSAEATVRRLGAARSGRVRGRPHRHHRHHDGDRHHRCRSYRGRRRGSRGE